MGGQKDGKKGRRERAWPRAFTGIFTGRARQRKQFGTGWFGGFFFLLLCFVLFFVFRAAPAACGGSQARGRFGAVAVSLQHTHSKQL